MAKNIVINQIGNTVFFLEANPNCRNEPSLP